MPSSVPAPGFDPFAIEWTTPTRAGWDAMLAACKGATLTQSAPYTLALAATGRTRADFGLIRFDGQPVGMVVAHGRPVLGAAGAQTIHRGPLFVHEEMPGEMVGLVLARLRRRFRLRRGRPVTFHPELPDTPADRERMARAGFRRVAEGYRTILLDLGADAAALRRGLAQPWRNALDRGERLGVTVADERDGARLDWLIAHHEAGMAARGYRGPSGELLRALQRFGNESAHLRLLVASHEDEPVCGVLLARHGDSATWLVGWTGEAGRRLRATHVALWRAIELLKADGVARFDLGGINDEAPGIAAFKAGLGGRELRLVGGYV